MAAIVGVSAVDVAGRRARRRSSRAGASRHQLADHVGGHARVHDLQQRQLRALPLAELAFGPRGAAAQVFVLSTQTRADVHRSASPWPAARPAAGGGRRRVDDAAAADPLLARRRRWLWRWLDRGGAQLPAFLGQVAGVPCRRARAGGAGDARRADGRRAARGRGGGRWGSSSSRDCCSWRRRSWRRCCSACTVAAAGHVRSTSGRGLRRCSSSTAGVPTAVNTLLLTIEVDGDARNSQPTRSSGPRP